MNRLSFRVLSSASLVLGLTMLLGGCGPQDINDPDYLMQLRNSGETNDKDDAMQGPQDLQAPQGQAMDANAPAVQTAPAIVAPAVVAIPEVIIAPPVAVVAPTVVEQLPPVVINTAEERRFAREVHHFREIRRLQPSVTQHTINNVTRVHHRYFTNIVNVPTHATQVCPTYSGYQTAEVMPTTEVTLPVAESIIPCVVGVGIGCGGPGIGIGGFGGGIGFGGYGGGYFGRRGIGRGRW